MAGHLAGSGTILYMLYFIKCSWQIYEQRLLIPLCRRENRAQESRPPVTTHLKQPETKMFLPKRDAQCWRATGKSLTCRFHVEQVPSNPTPNLSAVHSLPPGRRGNLSDSGTWEEEQCMLSSAPIGSLSQGSPTDQTPHPPGPRILGGGRAQ